MNYQYAIVIVSGCSISRLIRLFDNFYSSVYESYEDYMNDIFLISKSVDFIFSLEGETRNGGGYHERYYLDKHSVLIKKINASIRNHKHLDEGGTDIGFRNSVSDVFNWYISEYNK